MRYALPLLRSFHVCLMYNSELSCVFCEEKRITQAAWRDVCLSDGSRRCKQARLSCNVLSQHRMYSVPHHHPDRHQYHHHLQQYQQQYFFFFTCVYVQSFVSVLISQFGQLIQKLIGVHQISTSIHDTTGGSFTRFVATVIHQVLVFDIVASTDHEHHCLQEKDIHKHK